MRPSSKMLPRRFAILAALVSSFFVRATEARAQEPAYAAEYVGRTFPEANEKITLVVGETLEGAFELRNVGTATWSTTTTKIATIPRDAKSPLADESWENEGRCATVEAETPPGEVGRFGFLIRGNEPGDVTYAFGLVEEGVTWFADDGGPPDDAIFLRVRVVEPPPPTAVASTAAGTGATTGAGGGGGAGGGAAAADPGDGGCTCSTGRSSRASPAFLALASLGIGVAVARRRRG